MLGMYEKRKDRKVLTKSRTSPDPSEERRASLGKFDETKDFDSLGRVPFFRNNNSRMREIFFFHIDVCNKKQMCYDAKNKN